MRIALVFLLMASVLFGCDTREEKIHKTVDTFVTALRYHDLDSAVALHIDATPQGIYCSEEPFTRIWEAATPGPDLCEEVKALRQNDVEALSDAERLLLQVSRVRCEDPSATCLSYGSALAREVLQEDIVATGPWDDHEIRMIHYRDDGAIVYLDVLKGERRLARTVRLTPTAEGWRIARWIRSGGP